MDFSSALQKVVDNLRTSWQDRHITLSELKAALLSVMEFASTLATQLLNDGREKKALVLLAVGQAFDALWPHLAFPLYAAWLKPFLTPVIRAAILSFAEADIEFIYQRIVKTAPTTSTNQPEVAP